MPQRQAIKKIALARPADHGLAFSTWSLAKLAEFLVAEGVVDDISHEGFRVLLRSEEVSFQAVKTWKQSTDPDYEAKNNRVLELYDIAEAKAEPGPVDPVVVFSVDEFGPLNLLARAGKQWAPVVIRKSKGSTGSPRRRRIRATYRRTQGVRHLLAALDLNCDKLYGHIRANKKRTTFLEFCRYLRSLYPLDVRIAIVMDNFAPHLATKRDGQQRGVGVRAHQRVVLNRIECHFTALRYSR